MGQTATLVIGGAPSPFGSRSPKPDSISAIKLTEANAREVAAHILKTLGGSMEITKSGLTGGNRSPDTLDFGEWIVEEYSYKRNCTVYRYATMAEREKYDLR